MNENVNVEFKVTEEKKHTMKWPVINGVVAGTLVSVAHKAGLKKGVRMGVHSMACSVYADPIAAANMVKDWFANSSDDVKQGAIKFGKYMIEKGTIKK